MRKPKTKLYTISSLLFTSLEEAKEQLEAWLEAETLDEDAMVYEIKKAYTPIKKIELKEGGKKEI